MTVLSASRSGKSQVGWSSEAAGLLQASPPKANDFWTMRGVRPSFLSQSFLETVDAKLAPPDTVKQSGLLLDGMIHHLQTCGSLMSNLARLCVRRRGPRGFVALPCPNTV